MKNSTRLLTAVLMAGGISSAATAFTLTPDNAVGFVYSSLKRLNLLGLLPHCRGSEAKKLRRSIRMIKLSSTQYWALKKQSNSLIGYRVRKKEVYGDVAAITYVWKIRTRIPVNNGSNMTRPVTLKLPYELLLRKVGKKWYMFATRAKKPADEIGPQDYRRKMWKKRSKRKPVVSTF